ncbi:hypothetical protein [Domibacillus robiginosus]|uniref:hypothetical protein n=1 Tax=Domibacillus robiginosus TaxID=1071054 RepID=UPI00067CEBB9|nr:hypothetical protein [Domibacillus robiginosus]
MVLKIISKDRIDIPFFEQKNTTLLALYNLVASHFGGRRAAQTPMGRAGSRDRGSRQADSGSAPAPWKAELPGRRRSLPFM